MKTYLSFRRRRLSRIIRDEFASRGIVRPRRGEVRVKVLVCAKEGEGFVVVRACGSFEGVSGGTRKRAGKGGRQRGREKDGERTCFPGAGTDAAEGAAGSVGVEERATVEGHTCGSESKDDREASMATQGSGSTLRHERGEEESETA